MFCGPATLVTANARIKSVFGGSVAASLLLIGAIWLLPGSSKLIAAAVILVGFITVYPRGLSFALTPQRAPVDLYVDENGIYAGDRTLALREDIEHAYIRPAPPAGLGDTLGDASPLTRAAEARSCPLTIELLVRGRGQVNIDPGGQGAAAEILETLGFPVTTCAPHHRAQTNRQRATSAILVALFVVLYVSYYLFVSAHH